MNSEVSASPPSLAAFPAAAASSARSDVVPTATTARPRLRVCVDRGQCRRWNAEALAVHPMLRQVVAFHRQERAGADVQRDVREVDVPCAQRGEQAPGRNAVPRSAPPRRPDGAHRRFDSAPRRRVPVRARCTEAAGPRRADRDTRSSVVRRSKVRRKKRSSRSHTVADTPPGRSMPAADARADDSPSIASRPRAARRCARASARPCRR